MLNFLNLTKPVLIKVASINSVRYKSSFNKFKDWYRGLWSKQYKAPYNHICQVGEPTLRLQASEVNLEEIQSQHIKTVLLRLRNVMKKYKAVGISAPQIGIPLRIMMIEIPEEVINHFGPEVAKKREMYEIPFKVFINPVMEVIDYKRTFFPEACESLKGLSAMVPRYRSVTIKGYEYDGSPVEYKVKGWGARIVQHEIDHLEGKMYTDVMEPKTLQNDSWQMINQNAGNVKIYYKPR